MTEIVIRVEGRCQPAGSKRIGRHGDRPIVLDANPRSRDWKQLVALTATQERAKLGITDLWDEPLRVTMIFFLPRPKAHYNGKGTIKPSAPPYPCGRPDTLKLARGCEDSLTGIVWRDDAQIVNENLMKVYADGCAEGVLITVRKCSVE